MPRPTTQTKSLRADTNKRWDTVLSRANTITVSANHLVGSLWQEIKRTLRDNPSPVLASAHIKVVANQTYAKLVQLLVRHFTNLATWNHRETVKATVKIVPPSKFGVLVEDTTENLIISLVFPPPQEDFLNQIIFGNTGGLNWVNRITSLSKLNSPQSIAQTVLNGLAQGKEPQEIEDDLIPVVDFVRSSAKRIARTESIRVAHETQFLAWEQMGDLVIGYQIHATTDENTRDWHLKRDGQIYYKNPKPGQKGLDKMPRPPQEAPDTSERPPNTPQVAPNCRCYLTPVLRAI